MLVDLVDLVELAALDGLGRVGCRGRVGMDKKKRPALWPVSVLCVDYVFSFVCD